MLDLQKLEELGLDTEEGLACCAEDPEFYEEMLGEYIAEGRKKSAELKRLYDSADWADYGMRAHSVKSTSRTIGALTLSETARELEFAAKERNEQTIRTLHPAFLTAYTELLEKLRGILG
jgi:Hpt domain.